MSETQDFLDAVVPRINEADTAFHNGDAEPRKALWSREDPVTLFGAVLSGEGWEEVGGTFDRVAGDFSRCSSFEYEVVAAEASGDLAYIAGIEHTTASVRGGEPKPYQLRVTTTFRREDGEWRIVHRHGSSVPQNEATREQLARLSR